MLQAKYKQIGAVVLEKKSSECCFFPNMDMGAIMNFGS